MRNLRAMAFAGLLLMSGFAGPAAAAEAGLIRIDGAIGPATAGYIERAIRLAERRGDACLIVELDTPGGLLDSTKEIVQSFYRSRVPVIVYVSPEGASAGSAGCFITLAADIAAMAPNTTIGAAHPVSMGGGGDSDSSDGVMKKKMENYAGSFIEGIARKRGRNIEWARSAVTESESITAEKALELKVIDLIAASVPELLRAVDGREVNGRKLQTAQAVVGEIRMAVRERVFQLLWRPEVMLVLMLMAIYGIIGELSSPGAVLPGVVGAIALILVLYMSAILPVNVAGLALIGLALALFIVDVFAPTHGVLTFGGIAAFFLGLLMVFNRAEPGFRLSLGYIIPATVTTALFFIFLVGKGLAAQRLPAQTGREAMLGQVTPALTRIDLQSGTVFIEGEHWNAVSESPIEAGQPVEIIGLDGLTLRVKPKTL